MMECDLTVSRSGLLQDASFTLALCVLSLLLLLGCKDPRKPKCPSLDRIVHMYAQSKD
jgi:hypothetical protein